MLVKRSFTLSGHRTSVALEPAFWTALQAMAAAEGRALSALIAEIDAKRTDQDSLTSRLRVVALERRSR